MALAQYSDVFWFPNGALAANVPARIFPLSSSALAPIFTDITGATMLPNPLSTDGSGVLTFWAPEGEYWIHMDSEAFRVSVGNPINLDTFTGASVALSSGTISGGSFSPAGTSVSVSETVGYVVDYATDSFRPTLTRVDVPAQVVPLDGPALARTLTWWLIASNGTFVQQATTPTNIQRRTHIVLGFSVIFGGVVALTQAIPVVEPQPANQLADLMDAIGPFSVTGNVITPNGANLSINQSGGTLFSRSFNHTVTPNNPHIFSTAAQSPALFHIATQSTTVFPPSVTTIDPANYDVGGVITPVPGGANVSTLQRVFLFAVNNVPDQLAIQYGQATFPNLAAAAAAAGQGTFVVNPAFIGTVIGYIAVTKTATNLSDPTQATFIKPNTRVAVIA